MRTTLNLDSRAAVAARARARQRNITLGQAVSELVLAGLQAESSGADVDRRGLVLLPTVEGHLITSEMVAEALEDE